MAQFALLVWPLVAIVLYWRLSLPWALGVTIIGGYLLLPTQTSWDFTALPTFNKHTIPALAALVLTMAAFANRKLPDRDLYPPGWLPRTPLVLVLCAVFVLSVAGTVLTNSDALVYGPRVLPALSSYDILSGGQIALLTLIPFLLARRVFATPEAHRTLLMVMAGAGALYAFLALYEIRMSPQLNRIVYGFFPHDWIQHVRVGGWRPLVFLNHGLWLAIFFATAALAAFGLWRIERGTRRRWFLAIACWILGTLALSNSLTGLAVTLVLLPIVLFVAVRMQLLVAAAVSLVVLAYPTLRYADVVPTMSVLSFVERFSTARAASLEFRFTNEDQLLEKAKQRPVFGWGGWGRSRVYSSNTGRDLSTTDGRWVIVFGLGGWVGYLGEFGLLTVAILALAFRNRRYDPDPATAVLALVLTANLIDLIPNSGLSPITWLMAGALAGRLELKTSMASADRAVELPRRRALAYARGPVTGSPQLISEEPIPEAGPRFSRFPARSRVRS